MIYNRAMQTARAKPKRSLRTRAPARGAIVRTDRRRLCAELSTKCRPKRNLKNRSCARLGTFSKDPIGFAAGDANLYRYVGNGPTTKTDPSGLEETFTLPFQISQEQIDAMNEYERLNDRSTIQLPLPGQQLPSVPVPASITNFMNGNFPFVFRESPGDKFKFIAEPFGTGIFHWMHAAKGNGNFSQMKDIGCAGVVMAIAGTLNIFSSDTRGFYYPGEPDRALADALRAAGRMHAEGKKPHIFAWRFGSQQWIRNGNQLPRAGEIPRGYMTMASPARGNNAGGINPWDAAIYVPNDECWYGGNIGNANSANNWFQRNIIPFQPMRVVYWPNFKTFKSTYTQLFDTTFVFVVPEGPGTEETPRMPSGGGLAN